MFICSIENAAPFTVAGIKFGMLLSRDVTNSIEVVWESVQADQSTPVDRHPSFDQLFFLLKGKGEVRIGNETSTIGPHTLVFIPRNVDHSIRPVSQESLEYLYVNVWGQGVPESERDWKRAYSLIHDRRTPSTAASE
jgi:mannose-6-phosphate isomerase-like protein (cupin superfamily)